MFVIWKGVQVSNSYQVSFAENLDGFFKLRSEIFLSISISPFQPLISPSYDVNNEW